MELKTIAIENPEEHNFILGHAHFIKTVEDIHEAIVCTVPNARFGVAFCEASMECLVRCSGTDEALTKLAQENAYALGAGHSFIIFMKEMFPINILKTIQNVPEVVTIHCATANPVEVVLAQTDQGRGILGVIDGFSPKGIETDADVEKRKGFLRMIGYKQ
ncbi:MAG: adenosine-specific kinase [Desulfotignum sp.]|jgi:adenosine/AMP kinase|nr:adenosine-specific kinase [Desulfotignum sp.]